MSGQLLTTVLETLAKEIEELRITIDILRYEKKQLKEELELFKAPTQEVNKNA